MTMYRMDTHQIDPSSLRFIPKAFTPRNNRNNERRNLDAQHVMQYRPKWESDHVNILLFCRAKLRPLQAGTNDMSYIEQGKERAIAMKQFDADNFNEKEFAKIGKSSDKLRRRKRRMYEYAGIIKSKKLVIKPLYKERSNNHDPEHGDRKDEKTDEDHRKLLPSKFTEGYQLEYNDRVIFHTGERGR